MPVSWGDFEISNQRLKKYDGVLHSVALEHGIKYIHIFNKFNTAQQNDNLHYDGLHPNDKGHKLIYEIVIPEIQELLR